HQEDCVGALLLRFLQEGQPVLPGHAHVAKDEGGSEFGEPRERLLAVLRFADLVALVAQQAAQRAASVLLVVDQQNPSRGHPDLLCRALLQLAGPSTARPLLPRSACGLRRLAAMDASADLRRSRAPDAESRGGQREQPLPPDGSAARLATPVGP